MLANEYFLRFVIHPTSYERDESLRHSTLQMYTVRVYYTVELYMSGIEIEVLLTARLCGKPPTLRGLTCGYLRFNMNRRDT